ncbi:hypothetical protein [Szabonella alba]|uniref:Uncharacterized protein n=1 Tax=Szabonella alba TaxID=2804194 RepID=A0A8K0Y020_9RHOB|nr:hypothetical protein [Szabonella alba]MBL4917730.1 hypothetical protein [Szabonella alba]
MGELVSIVGVAIPMLTIAGSALAFVWKSFRDAKEDRRKQFFELMTRIDTHGTIAGKIAAVYHLRYFPEHKDFIIRFCDTQKDNINGDAARLLAEEMESTRDYFRSFLDNPRARPRPRF